MKAEVKFDQELKKFINMAF